MNNTRIKNQRLINASYILKFFSVHRLILSISLLTIVFIVPLVVVIFDLPYSIFRLTPGIMILAVIILALNQQIWNIRILFFSLITFITCMFFEIIGVATGFPFGSYNYGSNLGWQILNVPLIIGINWLIVAFSSASIANRLSSNKIISCILGAATMTILDLLIEPLAPILDFWYFNSTHPGLMNYFGWFVIGLLLNILFHFLKIGTKNKAALPLLFLYFSFFSVLIILLK